jgi:3-dehydro-4-phosphotetronate decarboxylase
MKNSEQEKLCAVAGSLYDRGYAFGSTGNLSLRIGERIWITPTGQSLRDLAADELAEVDLQGVSQNENRPSKELAFHLGVYKQRPHAHAIIHLHSLHAVALSCLESLNPAEPLPPLTPYYFMRVAPLAVIPYIRPGSPQLAAAVEAAATSHNSMLLRNHGLITVGSTLDEAVDRAEELEQTARLYFMLRNEQVRYLSADDIADINSTFG